MSAISETASAYSESLRTFATLGEQLTDADWAAPTQCPLWSVGDIYAHVAGPEAWFNEGAPPYEVSTQEWIDSHVAQRRGRPPAARLAELQAVLRVRLEQLSDAEKQPAVFIPILKVTGPQELGLRLRVFDLWIHEQDIRTALGRPGNMATGSARIAQRVLLDTLPRTVAKVAQAPRGSTVRITITGELPADVAVAVGEDGRGAWADAGPADLHLTMSWAAYARLGAGRGAIEDYEVTVDGDEELAVRVLRALNVAP